MGDYEAEPPSEVQGAQVYDQDQPILTQDMLNQALEVQFVRIREVIDDSSEELKKDITLEFNRLGERIQKVEDQFIHIDFQLQEQKEQNKQLESKVIKLEEKLADIEDRRFFLQKKGTAMGATCAPTYAHSHLGFWEQEVVFDQLGGTVGSHVALWVRFIDDILMMWEGSVDELEYFMAIINDNNRNLRIPVERNEYGSETDLYGLVSNILEEPEKAQPYFTEGGSPHILKSMWPLNTSILSEHQEFLSDPKRPGDLVILQKNVYGAENASNIETQKMEDLYHGLAGLAQDELWLYSSRSNEVGGCNDHSKMNFHDYPFDKNGFTSSVTLPEAIKDFSQKRTKSLLSQFSRYNSDTELAQYDMLSPNKTMQGKYSNLGIQECKNTSTAPSDLHVLDPDTYTKLFQTSENCQKCDSLMPELQNSTFSKAPSLMSDKSYSKESSFVPDFSLKSDYGLKALSLCDGNIDFASSLHKLRHDLQSSDFPKPACMVPSSPGANSIRSPWINGHIESNSPFTYRNKSTMLKASGHSSQKSSAQNYSSVSTSLASGDMSFQKYCQDNPAFPVFEYPCGGTERTQEGLCRTGDEGLFECIPGKRFNGFGENISNQYNRLDCIGKQSFQEKSQNIQYNIEKKNLESARKSYQTLIENAVNYKNHREGNGDSNTINISRQPRPQTGCFANTLMMGDIRPNTFHHLSANSYKSQFPHTLGQSAFNMMDSHDTYAYEDHGQMYPHFTDLMIHGDTAYCGMAPIFCNQRSIKPRSVPGSELHVHLEECYEQWRAMEKERKKTECILVKHYPGKKVSSSNNTPIPRLTSNPSRVDRLIVDQLREQARVITLLGKMERFRSSPLHANISTALDRQLEAIHIVQARRKDEIVNASNRQRQGGTRHQDDRDVFVLASAIKEMSAATRKARTALWCALQMTLPKTSLTGIINDLEQIPQCIDKPSA
ncbi:meiosis-specific coiled-coil domain-containing protein MEIOC [Pelodytes ibericus]